MLESLIKDDITHKPTTINRVCPLKIISPLVSKSVGFRSNVNVCFTAFLKVKSSWGTPSNLQNYGIKLNRIQKDIDLLDYQEKSLANVLHRM